MADEIRMCSLSSGVCSSDLVARPRLKDGSWWKDYDPVQIGHNVKKWRDYTEANGWQATFLNQHDVYGLIDHFGGDAALEKQLDALFHAPPPLPETAQPDISGLPGPIAHGNEPNKPQPYIDRISEDTATAQPLPQRPLAGMSNKQPTAGD